MFRIHQTLSITPVYDEIISVLVLQSTYLQGRYFILLFYYKVAFYRYFKDDFTENSKHDHESNSVWNV